MIKDLSGKIIKKIRERPYIAIIVILIAIVLLSRNKTYYEMSLKSLSAIPGLLILIEIANYKWIEIFGYILLVLEMLLTVFIYAVG